jgi:hypothetical protein
MTDLRQAAQQALEALDSENPDIQLRAALALRTALAQEHALKKLADLGQEIEQEPVISAWSLREVYFDEDGEPSMHRSPPAAPEQVDCPRCGHVCLQRPWVGLTNKEIAEILCDDRWQMRPELMLLACQAKLKEKNT